MMFGGKVSRTYSINRHPSEEAGVKYRTDFLAVLSQQEFLAGKYLSALFHKGYQKGIKINN